MSVFNMVKCNGMNSTKKSLLTPTNCKRTSMYVGKGKVKVKFTLEQATKAQRGSRGIALLFL